MVAANEAFAALVGGGSAVVGSAPWAAAPPADRAAAESRWRRAAAGGEPVTLRFTVSGRSAVVRLDARPLAGDGGYAGSVVDDTETASQSALLDRLLGVAGTSSTALVVFDRDGDPVFANPAAAALFGFDPAADPARDPQARAVLQVVRDQVPRHVLTATDSTTWRGEAGLRTPDGLERTLQVELLVHRVEGVSDYWAVSAIDVTEGKRVQAELARQATHDAHTGLPNRVQLLRFTAAALERSRETRADVAIVFVDVDRLKEVNDTAGHDAGDALIGHVAERLAHAIRPNDVVGRLGGDEFAVLCEGEIDEHTALEIAERLRRSITGTITTHGVEVPLSASIGVAVTAGGTFTGGSAADAALTLLRHADSAMYLAKRRGRGRAELYTESMRSRTEAVRRLTNELERALAAEELFLVYQPVVALHSGRPVGAEALLRWRHPERGVLLPADFIALAEDSGAIVPIGEWVLRTACDDAAGWLAAGLFDRSFSVHVNVSARQLAEGSFVERVRTIVAGAGLLPQQLTIDAAEHSFAGGGRRALQALRREGMQIALDGFGRGTSSLTALGGSDATVLKLDGHISESMSRSTEDDPVVRAIVQLAHALNMQVAAQWVRSADQLARLRLLGCDLVEGNLYGEPVEAEAFAARVRR